MSSVSFETGRSANSKDKNNAKNNANNSAKDIQRYSNETQMNSAEVLRETQRKKKITNSLVSRNFIENKDEEDREGIPNNMHAILESLKLTIASQESRNLGFLSLTLRISFYFIILFAILKIFFSSLSFVQLSQASVFIPALCMVLIVQHFINISAISLQNDSVLFYFHCFGVLVW